MHPNHLPKARQQERVRAHVGQSDAYAIFNLLTGPQLVERVEALLQDDRERVFPRGPRRWRCFSPRRSRQPGAAAKRSTMRRSNGCSGA
jgi:hypothetical protein